ncbi:DUF6080 domain-containing protein [Paenibacillus methanolicus]|uniref:YfhO family protein n=1 Tax=Paenibacillus methanolicus TaxID=582686 RepID=A0A5S5C210_9BACL|nr:DUF6080 domain-containing protein [Paenibacillus methanolicus]TYP72466.1 hypothetical protein BCM02_108120 [Paenibacillus methanolicus]
MKFFASWFSDKRDAALAGSIALVVALFCILTNLPFIRFMQEQAPLLAEHSPFFGTPFTLNLFNFDPSLYYGFDNATIIHPLFNVIKGSLAYLADHLGGNLFFLVLQACLNALSAVMVYVYLRRSSTESGYVVPAAFGLLFGISSYSLFSSLVPDSYPYAQSLLLLSVLYLQYSRAEARIASLPTAAYGLGHFAITSTNVVPFAVSAFAALFRRPFKSSILKLLAAVGMLLALIAVCTLAQGLLFDGHSWANDWRNNLDSGGYTYVASFSLAHHWKAVYMLFISPVLTPAIRLLDPGIVAFTTDLSVMYPLYVTLGGGLLLLLAVLGFLALIRTYEAWMLGAYIGFALALHIGVGYGLSTYQYDLYLYAGHYLFALFLLGGRFLIGLRLRTARTILTGLMLMLVVATCVHNLVQHADALDVIRQGYEELQAPAE